MLLATQPAVTAFVEIKRASLRAFGAEIVAARAFIAERGYQATAEDIQGFVKDKVASYKQVRQVAFVDEIPKSASGKILRRMLRDDTEVRA